jgi:hypothetical protein
MREGGKNEKRGKMEKERRGWRGEKPVERRRERKGKRKKRKSRMVRLGKKLVRIICDMKRSFASLCTRLSLFRVFCATVHII